MDMNGGNKESDFYIYKYSNSWQRVLGKPIRALILNLRHI